MANLRDVGHVRVYLTEIENILKSLHGVKWVSVDLLKTRLDSFKEANTLYKSVYKVTNDGGLSPALRAKYKKLLAWKTDPDTLVQKEVNMKKIRHLLLKCLT